MLIRGNLLDVQHAWTVIYISEYPVIFECEINQFEEFFFIIKEINTSILRASYIQ